MNRVQQLRLLFLPIHLLPSSCLQLHPVTRLHLREEIEVVRLVLAEGNLLRDPFLPVQQKIIDVDLDSFSPPLDIMDILFPVTW